MISCHNLVCGCEMFISASMIQCVLNAWIRRHIEKLISDYERSHPILYGQEIVKRLMHQLIISKWFSLI